MKRKLTCIICPVGCEIEVEYEGRKVLEVKGNLCSRGKEWAIKEVVSPERVVMSVVRVKKGELPTVSVKTTKPVPKEKIPSLMRMLAGIILEAPVEAGQVVLERPLGLDAKVVTTRSVRRASKRFPSGE